MKESVGYPVRRELFRLSFRSNCPKNLNYLAVNKYTASFPLQLSHGFFLSYFVGSGDPHHVP